MLIANNLCYGTGFSGIHVQLGATIHVVHNTLFGKFVPVKGKNIEVSFADCDDCTSSNPGRSQHSTLFGPEGSTKRAIGVIRTTIPPPKFGGSGHLFEIVRGIVLFSLA